MAKRVLWTRGFLFSVIGLWSAALILQNFAVIVSLRGAFAFYSIVPTPFKVMTGLAIAKAVIIVVAGFIFLRGGRRLSAAFFCLAVLYAFPLGLFVDRFLGSALNHSSPLALISLSAMLSYATVIAIIGVQVLRERGTLGLL
jgi:hypothetical protein